MDDCGAEMGRASRVVVLSGILGFLAVAPARGADPVEARVWLHSTDLAAEARRVPKGGTLVVEDLPIPPAEDAQTLGRAASSFGDDLELKAIDVFARDASIVVHGGGGRDRMEAAPGTAYFAGTLAGTPNSFAFLSVDEKGSVRGLVARDGQAWSITQQGATPEVTPIEAPQAAHGSDQAFECGTADGVPADLAVPAPAAGGVERTASIDGVRVVDVAVETDAEFFDLFDSTAEAIAYVGDLFAATSAIYLRDVSTVVRVSHLSLWPGTTGSDPWSAASTSAGLNEFQSYWNSNRTSIPRTTAHFLSGKRLGGGIAYVGVLCWSYYAYGLTASLNGAVSTTNPSLYWDLLAVSHEIGHNFNSPHSHCYSPPVDECYSGQSGCFSGTANVPTNGGGSIMSYCHLRSGGYSNVQFWMGRTGYYGTQSERVPQRMRAHVEGASCVGALEGPPVVTLDASPSAITPGGSTTLSWTATDADDCTASGAWSGAVPTTGTLGVSPATNATYSLQCTGPGGSSSDQVVVTVSSTLPPPVLDPITEPLRIGTTNLLGGSGFTAGSVVVVFVAGASPSMQGPFVPTNWSSTSVSWNASASLPLGNGFASVVVVNSDQGYVQSEPESQLLLAAPTSGRPTILAVEGTPLQPHDPSVPLAYVPALAVPGTNLTIDGSGFQSPLVALFTANGNLGPLTPLPGGTSTRIEVVVPANAPVGPGSLLVVNSPYTGNVLSNAVSLPIGETIRLDSVTQQGNIVTVDGAGFSTTTVINLFNAQNGTAVNLGGLNGSGAPRIPLTLVSSQRFRFTVPAGTVTGRAYVQALNPPFIAQSSTGTTPAGAFSITAP